MRVVPSASTLVVANVTGRQAYARFVVERVQYVEGGRAVDVAAVRLLRNEGVGPDDIAKRLGIGRASVYRVFSA